MGSHLYSAFSDYDLMTTMWWSKSEVILDYVVIQLDIKTFAVDIK